MPAGEAPDFDVIIVGGGPAGLSAALVLGRCRRQVLVCDAGSPRNAVAVAMHSFLSRDGVPPGDFLAAAREELEAYPNVTLWSAEVDDVRGTDGHFRAFLRDGRCPSARKVLLATGLVDELPPLDGIAPLWGKSVHTCPYCDGWEHRGERIAVYGKGKRGVELARAMTAWSDDLTLLSDGPLAASAKQRAALEANGIRIVEERVARLEGDDGKLRAVVLASGARFEADALFFNTRSFQRSVLAQAMGCHFTGSGGVQCSKYEATAVPGVYATGNVTKNVQLVIVAAADGARAAFGINKALTRERFVARASGRGMPLARSTAKGGASHAAT